MNEQMPINQPAQPDLAGNNNPQAYGPYTQIPANPYVNSYFRQEEKKVKEKTFLTKQMEGQFSFFSLASAVYAVFYAFCLYRNASGITYPFFVAGTLCYFFLSMKKLGVPYKKDNLFYVISILLLGISNCCTSSSQLLSMNKLGIFLLAFILMLHTVYRDSGWNFPKYIIAMLRTMISSFTCLLNPLQDFGSFLNAQKQKKNDKKSYFPYIMIGLAISVPVLAVMIALLCSADIVFENMITNLISFDISLSEIIKIGLLIVTVFFISYALLAALCKKNVKEEVSDKKIFEPVIAIIVTGMLSLLYLTFSMIQILYLFIGNMQLPDGYTYSAYARQGFFQLLAVCIINLILVLFCLHFFKDNLILKIILTVISGCTYIMILSSALRMFMYIERYNLTFLRIFVLWALAVIFLLMTGVTIYIYYQRFPFFFYSVVITTVFYIGLSFAHPDYWIAKYNLDPSHLTYLDEYDISDSQRYLFRLSADAAPILLNEDINLYLPPNMESVKKFMMLHDGNYNKYSYRKYERDSYPEDFEEVLSYDEYTETQATINNGIPYWYQYYEKIYNTSQSINFRNFNFSYYNAKKSAGL